MHRTCLRFARSKVLSKNVIPYATPQVMCLLIKAAICCCSSSTQAAVLVLLLPRFGVRIFVLLFVIVFRLLLKTRRKHTERRKKREPQYTPDVYYSAARALPPTTFPSKTDLKANTEQIKKPIGTANSIQKRTHKPKNNEHDKKQHMTGLQPANVKAGVAASANADGV